MPGSAPPHLLAPLLVACCVLLAFPATATTTAAAGDTGARQPPRRVLLFGGNGLIGASVVDGLLQNAASASGAGEVSLVAVSRGNWYWDSKRRVRDRVDRFIRCDRKSRLETCAELTTLLEATSGFDVVYDFSARDFRQMNDSVSLLKGKVGLYVFVSAGSVYEVCGKVHNDNGHVSETDATRPRDPGDQYLLSQYHTEGHGKLEAEETLEEQRHTPKGFPYFIVRLPDVFGPRDTTNRFALYQLWLRMAAEAAAAARPVMLPHKLRAARFSLVYSEDVARVLVELLSMETELLDGEAVNLAYPTPVTLQELLEQMQEALGLPPGEQIEYWPKDHSSGFYLYPSIWRGPMNVSKAETLLHWTPTPLAAAVKTTCDFYEEVMKGDEYSIQKDELVQILGQQLMPDDQSPLWDSLEKAYGINLGHFRPRDEL